MKGFVIDRLQVANLQSAKSDFVTAQVSKLNSQNSFSYFHYSDNIQDSAVVPKKNNQKFNFYTSQSVSKLFALF